MKNLRHHPRPLKRRTVQNHIIVAHCKIGTKNLDPTPKHYRQPKTQFSRLKEVSTSVSGSVPVAAPGPLWGRRCQFLGKQALIITGGQKAASSRNLADLSRGQPRSLANITFPQCCQFQQLGPSTCRSLNSCCSGGWGVGSSGCLPSFKKQMCAPDPRYPLGSHLECHPPS